MKSQRLAFVGVLVSVSVLASSVPAGAQSLSPPVTPSDEEGVDVLGAFADSVKLLLIEHTIRIAAQDKTRLELGGPFWSDYRHSLRVPHQWEDSDAWWVNYMAIRFTERRPDISGSITMRKPRPRSA